MLSALSFGFCLAFVGCAVDREPTSLAEMRTDEANQTAPADQASPASPAGASNGPTRVEAVAFDFVASAYSADWHNADGPVVWDGESAPAGMVAYVNDRLEDGRAYPGALFTHPAWISGGFIHGAFRSVTVPSAERYPRLLARFGFREGAVRSDGATFWFSTLSGGAWVLLGRANKGYDGTIGEMSIDLSAFAGQTMDVFMNVDAGPSPDWDWATWTEARILARSDAPSAPENGGATMGEVRAVYTDAEMPFAMDSSLATLRASSTGRWAFFHTMGPTTYKYEGTPTDPFQTLLWQRDVSEYWNANGYDVGYACFRFWTQSVRKIEGSENEYLAIAHVEKFPRTCGEYDDQEAYSIGIGYSRDGGEHWTFGGDIVRSGSGRGEGDVNNVGGSPVIEVGEFFYLYFNEHHPTNGRYLAVARSPVADVVAAARVGQTPRWRKYADGEWTADGITGVGDLVARSDGHTDAARSTYDGRYYMLMPAGTQLWLARSLDGLAWENVALVDEDPSGRSWFVYGTFVDLSGASNDSMEIGRVFSVLWPRKNSLDYGDDTMFERRIRLN